MEGYITPHPATAFPETPVTLREIGQEVADLWQRALDVDLVPWAKLVGLLVAFVVGYGVLSLLSFYVRRWWRRRRS